MTPKSIRNAAEWREKGMGENHRSMAPHTQKSNGAEECEALAQAFFKQVLDLLCKVIELE